MIAIIAATKDEVSEFLNKGRFREESKGEHGTYYRSKIRPDSVVAVGGIGAERARACADEVIDTYRPTTVVSTGFAGGIQPELQTGDIVLCDTISQTDDWSDDIQKESIEIGLPDTKDDRATIGGCLTVPMAIADVKTKREIGRRFNLTIIDMESYWVCKTSMEKGVDCVVARVVLDTLDQRLPGVVRHVADGKGSAVKYLATHPAELPAAFRLWRQVRKATTALAEYLLILTTTNRLSTLTKHSIS